MAIGAKLWAQTLKWSYIFDYKYIFLCFVVVIFSGKSLKGHDFHNQKECAGQGERCVYTTIFIFEAINFYLIFLIFFLLNCCFVHGNLAIKSSKEKNQKVECTN